MNPNNLNGTAAPQDVAVPPQVAIALVLLDQTINGVASACALMAERCQQPDIARVLKQVVEGLLITKADVIKQSQQRIHVVPAGALAGVKP